jgi:hypothetical protein
MTDIPWERVTLPTSRGEFDRTLVRKWTLANGETGEGLALPNHADRSVQVSGTFGSGGSVSIEGSLDGTTWATLTDPQGNNLAITTAKIETVMEATLYIRPRVTAGDGTTALTITVLCRGA